MEVAQFRYGADNFGYLVTDGGFALAVDAGAPADMARYAEKNGIAVRYAAHTHEHPDHTPGTARLAALTGARILSRRELVGAGGVALGGGWVKVLETPGHTADSLCFLAGGNLVSGDTLFNGTVGNCFSGDLAAFYHSVKLLMALPPETVVWAGHDYVRESLAFARSLTGDFPALSAYAAKYDPENVRSTLADELLVNPYMKFNAKDMLALMEARGLPADTEFARFKSVMELY